MHTRTHASLLPRNPWQAQPATQNKSPELNFCSDLHQASINCESLEPEEKEIKTERKKERTQNKEEGKRNLGCLKSFSLSVIIFLLPSTPKLVISSQKSLER